MIDHEMGLPADGRVVAIEGLDLRVEPAPHPLELAHAEKIAAHWSREQRANPALYNGRLILQREMLFEKGHVRAIGHEASFASFLWWRRQADLTGACHLFGYPVLVSGDGALIAVEMAAHTANPGQVYFAAGSLDPSDVVDGRCDLHGNMRREVLEETGLDLATAQVGGGLYASYRPHKLTLFQLFRFAEPSEVLLERIAEFAKAAPEQEILRAVAIRSPDRDAQRYGPAMLPILDWYFETVV
ncbi:NUDIX hydrolase [Rhizobium glycinendophyticum]|uniref:NUDIX hydrolase n=1 Tax=Rhizobium glycinendophyticum TaxID=2589807 RepID=A0A504U888_9HYPH|nr:NUDIX hydrolase [Rhizobium glycinendophyticum]TPP11384.1 NUDIX hydrolase [Rhizobium glycinendophyticum]